jgi:hypothetical protein
MTAQFGKYLIAIGLLIIIAGLILYFRDTIPFLKHLGKLPGDIAVIKENFSFYFPLATGILISIVLSLLLFLFNKLR